MGTRTEPPTSFDLEGATAILERTPASLSALLTGLPDRLLTADEGEGTWSPLDVLGHLVHTERVNWLPRARHILAGSGRPFAPLDRTATGAGDEADGIEGRLETFADLRRRNLASLAAMRLTDAELRLKGLHPELGEVTLGQLIATWAVHDLTHIAQVVRCVAKAYSEAVGPWSAYLSVLRDRA